jgi:hypothetical protein
MTRAYNTATTQQNSGGVLNPFTVGKNKIINGDFGVWQRGTTFSSGFTADRWITSSDVGLTFSQQTFTPGTAPVAEYEGTYFGRFSKTSGGGYGIGSYQKIEDVRVLAGQTATLSFWAKADSAITITPYYNQLFGSGGSGTVGNAIGTVTLSTSWARYSLTFSMPSMSGKTIGTNSFTEIYVTRYIGSAAVVIDLWGVQLEAGPVATPFQTSTGNIQAELAACQRYYWRITKNTGIIGHMYKYLTSDGMGFVELPVSMRVVPTSMDSLNVQFQQTSLANNAIFGPTINADYSTNKIAAFTFGQTGLANGTQGYAALTSSGYVAFSAEL